MNEPRRITVSAPHPLRGRIWWARPGKLCLLERPGGGGRSHRPERRAADIEYLISSGVRLVVSTMPTKHNLADYDAAGLEWRHFPVPDPAEGGDALDKILRLLRRELKKRGAVAVHGNRQTDFVAAVGAAYLRDVYDADATESLAAAEASGLRPTLASAALLGVDYADQPRSAMAAATSSGRSVMT
jgi:hypothetical protein